MQLIQLTDDLISHPILIVCMEHCRVREKGKGKVQLHYKLILKVKRRRQQFDDSGVWTCLLVVEVRHIHLHGNH